VLSVDGEVRGFVIRAPWGGGATVAPDPMDAMRILRARRRASADPKAIELAVDKLLAGV